MDLLPDTLKCNVIFFDLISIQNANNSTILFIINNLMWLSNYGFEIQTHSKNAL